MRGLRMLLMGMGMTAALACDPGSAVAPSGSGAQCPACECACDCGPGGGSSDSSAGSSDANAPASPNPSDDPQPSAAADTGELLAGASRKMMHGDGKGCLADLNRVRALDPKLDRRMDVSRAQCEMLIGRCQEGKRRATAYYERESAMSRPRAAQMAESLASMRCRGGNSSDRDRLLGALFELNEGAYIEPKATAFCADRVRTIRSLIPRVQPRNADDHQVRSAPQALFHTAASCYARAGDCAAAYRAYRDLFPSASLSAITDSNQRESIVRNAFDSSVPRCATQP